MYPTNPCGPMEITPINFLSLPGRIYRGTLPWTIKNEGDTTIARLKTENIAHIVLLCPEHEYQLFLKFDLKEFYENKGFHVDHFPIEPGITPPEEEIRQLNTRFKRYMELGENTLIHCLEGERRTAVVISCFAADLLQISAKQAIRRTIHEINPSINIDKYSSVVREIAPCADESSEEEELPPTPGKQKKGHCQIL